MLAIANVTSARAELVECVLSEPCTTTGVCLRDSIDLHFVIDRNQFADAVNVNDPPRRKVTLVTLGDEEFSAEPMIIGDVRGFWQDTEATGDRIFTMQADGSGVYSESPSGKTLTGSCEVS